MIQHGMSRRRVAALAMGALGAASVVSAVGAAADTTTTTTDTTTSYAADCRASVLMLSIGGMAIPIPAAEGCDAGDAFLPPIDLTGQGFPLALQALYASTKAGPEQGQGLAKAGVLSIAIPLGAVSGGQLPDITAEVLTSKATCDQGVASGGSKVVHVNIGGEQIEVPSNGIPSTLDLDPLPAKIVMNEHLPSSSPSGPTTTTSSTTSGNTTTTVVTTTSSTTQGLTQRALHVTALDGTPLAVDLVVSESQVACTVTTVERTVTTVTKNPPTQDTGKRMTGGGKIAYAGGEASHGLTIPCDGSKNANLNVNGDFGSFKLTSLNAVSCSYDTNAGAPEHAKGTFNTMTGSGTGTCDGAGAVPISFTLTDEGEPNAGRDKIALTIGTSGQPCYLSIARTPFDGNHQAHG